MDESQEGGRRLLSAVERIIAGDDTLIGAVDAIVAAHPKARSTGEADRDALREDVGRKIVSAWSNRSALSGGATALPALLPGMGTLATVAGGALVDMALMLKFEVEMVLALSWLHGFDIRTERERQIAFLLAGVSTFEAREGRPFVVDLADAEAQAVWNYAPREMGKAVVSVFAKLALAGVGRGVFKALPLVGVGVGAGMNKVLTARVGERAMRELARRRRLADFAESDDVSEAQGPAEDV